MARRRPRTPPMPRRHPIQPRASVTVDAIVIAVERILDKTGPRGLTTNHIAEVAGVSIGTLYQYFPNKEALVAAVHQRYLDQTLDACRAVLAAARAAPLPQVASLIAAALFATKGDQRPIHRWLADLRSDTGVHDRYRALMDAFVVEVSGFLRDRTGLADRDASAAAFVLVHAIDGIIVAASDRPELPMSALGEHATAMVSRFLETLPPAITT